MFQAAAQKLIEAIVALCTDLLFPMMIAGFILSVLLKGLVLFTVRRQWWFAKEFEKRTVRLLEKKELRHGGSFFVTTKRLLERTYYQLFEVRGIMMRRHLDYITSPVDRLFAIQTGCALLVRDTLQEIRFLRKDRDKPDFLDISRSACSRNAGFGKLFGWIPLGPLNDVLNLLPGLFIIGGIFGTVLGIMEALPELSQLDIKDPEGSKLIMDTFLLKISFSISTSVVGIMFSVLLTIFYSLAAPEKIFVKMVDSYSRCLARLWQLSEVNEIPGDLREFDEHQDPQEALAQLALEKGISAAEIHHKIQVDEQSGVEDPLKKAS